ncbi:hypothetical protein EYF80_027538 [Liparis tanakae]|uniref:Uncharacterized protein n=1 Tax=Liparis tanakae TaxID=230148 RepID=A0A4Z2HBL0_9TELE|nr:hypothetical protein EYF80_027538 [Liparis tanakae]
MDHHHRVVTCKINSMCEASNPEGPSRDFGGAFKLEPLVNPHLTEEHVHGVLLMHKYNIRWRCGHNVVHNRN